MKRKLIKQGGAGFTIYVPKKWIDSHGLRPGDEVDVEEAEDSLLISAQSISKRKEVCFKLTDHTRIHLSMILNNIYRMGADLIKIEYQTEAQAKTIRNLVDDLLLGFEVTEAKNNRMTIESVAEPSGEKQEILLRRIFLLLKESFEILSQDMATGKLCNLEKIKTMIHKIAQYDNSCRRNITKKRFTEDKINLHWGIYNYLMVASRAILHVYEYLSENQPKRISAEVLEAFESIRDSYGSLYEAFFKKDLVAVGVINQKLRRMNLEHIPELISSSKGSDSVILYFLGELSRGVYLTTSPMLGLLIA